MQLHRHLKQLISRVQDNVRITRTDLSVAFPTFVTFTLGWTVIQRLDTLGMGIARNAIAVSLS